MAFQRIRDFSGFALLALMHSAAAQSFAADRNTASRVSVEQTVTGRYIIELEPFSGGSNSRREDISIEAIVNDISTTGYDVQVKDDFTSISSRFQGAALEINATGSKSNDTASVVDDIKRISGILDAWPVHTIPLNVSFEKTSSPPSWNPHAPTRVDELHARNITGAGQRVCVIDSGADVNHPSLAGGVVGGKNMLDDSDDITDCSGHGTFVSSMIVASHQDFIGVAPDAEVFMYKIFGCEGSTADDLVLKGLLAADADDCDIISLSVGADRGYKYSVLSRVASEIAQDRLVIIAAGNSGFMGPYFASSPAAGQGVLSVGSINAVQLMAWPATIVSSSGEVLNISYVTTDGSKFNETVDVPLDFDNRDACNLLDNSGSLSRGVIVKRGVCYPQAAYSSIMYANYGFAIIYDSYNQGVFYQHDVVERFEQIRLVAMTLASVGEWAAEQVAKGHMLELHIEANSSPAVLNGELASTGQISEFTSWGPTFENDFSPIVSAPGGDVFGAFPDNVFAVASGTSFATPYVAGIAALWYAAGNKDPAEFKRRLVAGSVALPAFNAGEDKAVAEVASLAQQGAGLVDAAKVFDYAVVLLSEPTLSLNDTDNRVSTHIIRLQNTGSEEVTFEIIHSPATTVNTRSPLWYIYGYYPPLSSDTGSLESPKTVTIAAGAAQEFEITLTPPDKGPNGAALWSGKVVLQGSNGEILSVPYIGVEASTYEWTALHHSPESYYYDQSTGELFPIDYQGHIYRPKEDDSPQVWFALRYGTYHLSIDIVGEDWTTDQFSWPPSYGVGPSRWLGPIRHQPVLEWGYTDFPMRDLERFSQGGYVTFRSLANGTDIPSGRYRIFSRALRIFGEETNPDDWQLFLSDPFSIQLGDDPIPDDGETSTSAAPTATTVSTIVTVSTVSEASSTTISTASEPVTTSASTTSSVPIVTDLVSVPGITSTLTATAIPTGLPDAFTSLRLQQVRSPSQFFTEMDVWMELRIKVFLPDPVEFGSTISFAVPDEIIDIAADLSLDAPAATVGRTSFDTDTRLFTITLGDWPTWHRNMRGDFYVFCRIKPEFAEAMELGTYVVQFATVGRIHETPIYYTVPDRTAVYERLHMAPYDETTLFLADIEVPGRLGSWDYVSLSATYTIDADGFICANSSVSVGKVACSNKRLARLRDVTEEAIERCDVKNFRAKYNGTVGPNEAVRFSLANIQGSWDQWTLSLTYALDILFSNGTLALFDYKTLLFEKNARQRFENFNAFSGDRA